MKRAQIQLGESIFVVIIIMMLIVVGIVFYAQAQREGNQTRKSEFNDLGAVSISQYATSLTELQCSLQEVQTASCYDITKIDAFTTLMFSVSDKEAKELSQELYFSQLGNAKLEIQEIYPNSGLRTVLYDNQPSDSDVSQFRADIPITLYDPVSNTNSFGVLTIIAYQQ